MAVKGLVLPGYGNSGEGHWQTLWESDDPSLGRVELGDWEQPVASVWIERLEAAVAEAGPDTVLIAHSLACLLVARWAAATRLSVGGALLVAPPDPRASVFPASVAGFDEVPLTPLDFPSVLVASSDDVYADLEFSRGCAAGWGSSFVDIGPAGHINAARGYGPWPRGRQLLQELRVRVERSSRRAP